MYKANQDIREYMEDHGVTQYMLAEEVGMAQAVSYAAKRMFESLDKQQENKIYAK
jgi:predicted transcriptional regulator